MKRIICFLLLIGSITVKAQTLPDLIDAAQTYNDANIVTNASKSITAVKVNTTFTKVIDALRYINDNGISGGGASFYTSNGTMSNFSDDMRTVDFVSKGMLFTNMNNFTIKTLDPDDASISRTMMDLASDLVILGDQNTNNGRNSETVQLGFRNASNETRKSFTLGRDNSINADYDIYTIGNKNEFLDDGSKAQYVYLTGKENKIHGGTELFVTGRENNITGNSERMYVTGQENTSTSDHYSFVTGQENNSSNNWYSYVFGRLNNVTDNTNTTTVGQANYMHNAERAYIVGLENELSGHTNNIFGYSNSLDGEHSTTIGSGNLSVNCDEVNVLGRENNIYDATYCEVVGSSNKVGINADDASIHYPGLLYTGAFGHDNVVMQDRAYAFGKGQHIKPGEQYYVKIGVGESSQFAITPQGIKTPKTSNDTAVSFGDVVTDGDGSMSFYIYVSNGSGTYMFKVKQ